MKKKTYKRIQNKLYRAHKAWIIESRLRRNAEAKIQAAEDKAERYQRRFRSIGSNVETIDPGLGKIKMLKWTIQTEQYGNYTIFSPSAYKEEDEQRILQLIKERLAESIAKGLIENDIVQFERDCLDPLNHFGTIGGKLYVVPWEYMAHSRKTIELFEKAKDTEEITSGVNQMDVADVMNRINEALEGTGHVAVGYDNTENWLQVVIDKE